MKPIFTLLVGASLLLTCFSALANDPIPAANDSTQNIDPITIQTVEAETIKRFIEMDPYVLYRGSQPDEKDLDTLKEMGIRTVMSFRNEKDKLAAEKAAVEARGMQFISFPMDNFPKSLIHSPSHKKMKKIFKLIRDPKNQPVFMHCAQGKDRTGLVAAEYRVHFQGWYATAAVYEWFKLSFNPVNTGLSWAFWRDYWLKF